jgi:hypothetical protein
MKATINLDATPRLKGNPNQLGGTWLDAQNILHHNGGGNVEIQKNGNDLYVGGRKVVFHNFSHQKEGRCLRRDDYPQFVEEIKQMKNALNACVLDFLIENQDFLPENWGYFRSAEHILFCGTLFERNGSMQLKSLRRNLNVRLKTGGWGPGWEEEMHCLDADLIANCYTEFPSLVLE